MHLEKIAGLEVRALAQEFGTPLYVYDRAKIEERIADLKRFPTIRFAQKANSNLAVLALMKKNGVVVDAVSVGEIKRALAAGYSPKDIVYTADVFSREALDLASELDLPVNCGSPDMIQQYGERKPGKNITLRINPGFGHGFSEKTNTGGDRSKHGIWHEQLPQCLELASRYHLAVTGIHMHIGSGNDLGHLAEVCEALKKSARLARQNLTMISGGGGLPIPYRPTDKPLDVAAFTELWLKTKADLERELGKKLELEVEPGRYLVAESGYLIAEIRAVKKQGNYRFYLLDAGFNALARPILYGAYHPMSVCPAKGSTLSEKTNPVVVGGPLCESGDIFTQKDGGYVETRELPEAKVGDFLVIGCAGAYSFTMASNYNGYPLPAEVMISQGSAKRIRARQSVDDLFAGESIPEGL